MDITYLRKDGFLDTLRMLDSESADFAIVISAALEPKGIGATQAVLDECVRVLRDGGLLFVQGRPEYLPEIGVHLADSLTFKYWIAIESSLLRERRGLPSEHGAVLLFVKGEGAFPIKRIRFPHRRCAFCGRNLRDWGGKSHLMHPEGYVISDVWKDLPKQDNYSHLSLPALETILRLLNFDNDRARGVIGPLEGLSFDEVSSSSPSANLTPRFLEVNGSEQANEMEDDVLDIVHHGDAVEVLRSYPDNSVDLAFADPPYNLEKPYNAYDDRQADEAYISWCNSWLREYIRVLKPTGSLYVLNLPKWAIHHATFLNRHLHFQNWIVWDALSDPRGKLLPAHYALLFYTKHPTDFTFNYGQVGSIASPAFCLRASCIRERKRQGVTPMVPLTDIWWDIHRIKHKKDRDMHPCQLPDRLMERIILLSTNPGDVVLDALCGAGTTPVAAAKLGRRYIAVDMDERYVEITRRKVAEVGKKGHIVRRSIPKPKREYIKKALQLELRDLALRLGRLPTEEDVQRLGGHELEVFKEAFPSWGKALKAAKLEVQDEPQPVPN